MEATTSSPTTGSRTIADLLPRAAERYGDRTYAHVKRDGSWQDVSYREIGDAVSEIGRGLIDLGVAPGDRVALLAGTRLEWTLADFGISCAGAVVVPIYPTNSPKECEWVIGNSQAIAVVCENAAQVAKVVAVRDQLPDLRHIVVMDPGGDTADAIALAELRERGRGRDATELRERYAAVTGEDIFTIIYTSGTTGPPKGCIISHGNYRSMLDMVREAGGLASEEGDLTYLFLPLAHSFALLIQLAAIDGGTSIAYNSGDTKLVIQELSETRPTFLPSVPRIFEKLYTAVNAHGDPERIAQAVAVGRKVRALQAAGEEVPAELQAGFDQAEELLFSKVRAAFGGRIRECITGAAPISREILEFFGACGIPVMEGYGMTETSTACAVGTLEHHRYGTVGRALPQDEVRIAEDGEIVVRGPNIFKGYWRNEEATAETLVDGWLHTGDLGEIDADGYISITGRKKDIIITAGGKNLTPANIENDLKQSRWISQAVMHGDRRPFPVALITLDGDEILPWAREQRKPEDLAALAEDPDVRALVQAELDRANEGYASVGQIKKFVILDHDLSQETGELTPTLKVKRNIVNEKYAGLFDELYG
jgi:long-chain acyl-CoA synthetase